MIARTSSILSMSNWLETRWKEASNIEFAIRRAPVRDAGKKAPSISPSEQNRQEEERQLAQQRADAAILQADEARHLYRALVHDSGKSAGEKLAILKRHLKGDCLDLVQGLGGGEPAYIEALVRLKQSCGRRDVMRAATLQAIDKVELKNDPAIFKRFAERIRTHLFDLSRIGESNAPDLIEKISMRLQPPDRLEWNRGRRGGLETRSLNAFGSWLCERAAEYQNAYSIAAEQNTSSVLKPPRSHARSHRQPTTTQHPRSPSGHSVSSAKETTNWKIVAGYVSDVLERNIPLVHDPDRPATGSAPDAPRTETTRTATAHLWKQSPQQVAMGMMRLKVSSAENGSVWANVFIDEGSDSTLMRQSFASANRISGVHQILTVEGAGGVVKRYRSQRVNFQIDTIYVESFVLYPAHYRREHYPSY
ncbi:LOW QUALITY PROTEIN: hypothetical protein DAPPUDRAFT_265126 [Daphnia pulex]|uniref:Peptidase A2 domain-containing protein n=1 Tax=Daphnia pulex TaxID=6669 RepID=E9HSX2_DAPPU|nr:LOW QUALITY PROTEIN: hypothetical protein DAPPUDRAFT_265126 [Daphnia pulex]|eukprot:EFX65163.1 LOW QUALITY PROTEIN: hypothetical protein DAPPUDRAFT_265126 [Daphnia pulex]